MAVQRIRCTKRRNFWKKKVSLDIPKPTIRILTSSSIMQMVSVQSLLCHQPLATRNAKMGLLIQHVSQKSLLYIVAKFSILPICLYQY